MENDENQYDNENAADVSVKDEPEILYEVTNGLNCSSEIMDEDYDSGHNINKSNRRRSRRTRTKNVRYRSAENNQPTPAVSPENIRHNGKLNSDKDYTVQQEPSSSTSRRGKILNDCKNYDTVDHILKEIGLYDEMHDFLKASGITGEALKYMQIRHIDELFKDTNRLGTKIIFEQRLKEWQNKNGNCEVSTTQSGGSVDKVNNQNEIKAPHLQDSLNGMLPEIDFKNLSTLLTNAVQQTINTVLQEFKKSGQKDTQNKTSKSTTVLNREIPPMARIALKKIKIEPIEETILPDNPPRSLLRNSSKLVRVSDDILLSNQSVDITISPQQAKRRKVDLDMSVKDILTSTTAAENILHEYDKTEHLTPEQSNEIVHCIVDFYIRHKLIMTISRCKEIAEEILQLFPTESLEFYFIQDNKTRSPKGKLWEHYQERKRAMRSKISALKSRQRDISKNDSSASDIEEESSSKSEYWSDMQAMCTLMKHITDEKELFEKWKESFAFRRHQLQNGWFSNWKLYFDEYPFCKQQNYAEFIESDLQTLYPKLKFSDFLWNEFMENFPKYFVNRIKYVKAKQLLDQLIAMDNRSSYKDYVAIRVFDILHAILNTFNNKLPSIEEVQRKFSVEVADLSDLKKVVIERKRYCTENNIQAKPYIAVVGKNKTYSNFSVILDSTGFSCDNFKDSLILCFNLYLFFEISFPLESLNVWTFIQKYFFNKPPLVSNQRVDSFINEIKDKKKKYEC